MIPELETFILYYIGWHEHEYGFAEFKQSVLGELGEEGFKFALIHFREMRLAREADGDRRTYYEATK